MLLNTSPDRGPTFSPSASLLQDSPSFNTSAWAHLPSSCGDLFFCLSSLSIWNSLPCSSWITSQSFSQPGTFQTSHYSHRGLEMISKTGHSCHAEKGIALGVLYMKTLFAHLTTFPSFPCFSHRRKPLPPPPCFCWTLISCGFLFPGPFRWWKGISTVSSGLPELQHPSESWLWSAAGQGWALAGGSCLPGVGLNTAPPNKQFHLCFSTSCKAGKILKFWFLFYFLNQVKNDMSFSA